MRKRQTQEWGTRKLSYYTGQAREWIAFRTHDMYLLVCGVIGILSQWKCLCGVPSYIAKREGGRELMGCPNPYSPTTQGCTSPVTRFWHRQLGPMHGGK